MVITSIPFNALQVATNYADNCGGPVSVITTDTLLIGDNCGWVLIYTYKVVDVCGNALNGQTITHTGSDQSAPSGAPPGASVGNNACKANAVATFPFNATLAGANYTDNCGGPVVVVLTNTTVVGTDCSWAIIYTFSVRDACNNALNAQQMVISGKDLNDPTFTRPPDIIIYSNEACEYNASVGVTGDVTDEDDDCTNILNATYTDNVVDGLCSCSKIITRTWNLVDACGNAADPQVQTIYVHFNMVTNDNDDGPGSMRNVISCAPAGSTVTLSPSLMGQDIILSSGEITINKNLTLQGLGMLNSMVSGNMSSRIFHLLPGNTFTVRDMALKNATSVSNGGAIYVEGSLRLENVILQNNFENGVPKAMTLNGAGSFEAMGTIQIMY